MCGGADVTLAPIFHPTACSATETYRFGEICGTSPRVREKEEEEEEELASMSPCGCRFGRFVWWRR